nr:MAG TPA: hypothetical protein [Microviridae sp.]
MTTWRASHEVDYRLRRLIVWPHSPATAQAFYTGIIRERPRLGPFLQSIQILYL